MINGPRIENRDIIEHCPYDRYRHKGVGGRLVLVDGNASPEIGQLAGNNVHDLFKWTEKHERRLGALPEYKSSVVVRPYIINEQMDLSRNELCFYEPDEELLTVQEFLGKGWVQTKEYENPVNEDSLHRILAYESYFSDTHLKKMVYRHFQEGDRIFVKCINANNEDDGPAAYFVYRTLEGEVVLYELKESKSRESGENIKNILEKHDSYDSGLELDLLRYFEKMRNRILKNK